MHLRMHLRSLQIKLSVHFSPHTPLYSSSFVRCSSSRGRETESSASAHNDTKTDDRPTTQMGASRMSEVPRTHSAPDGSSMRQNAGGADITTPNAVDPATHRAPGPLPPQRHLPSLRPTARWVPSTLLCGTPPRLRVALVSLPLVRVVEQVDLEVADERGHLHVVVVGLLVGHGRGADEHVAHLLMVGRGGAHEHAIRAWGDGPASRWRTECGTCGVEFRVQEFRVTE